LKIFLTLFSFSIAQISFSQDSIKQWTFQKQIDFWSKWQNHNMFAKVSMPSYIKDHRNNLNSNTGVPTTFDSITDNPLRHGATYIALKTQTGYKNKISLFADLYAEHRGASYGIFNMNNTVVFPVVKIELKDSIRLSRNTIALSGKVGQFLNAQLDEGLAIYNMDVQGIQVKATYKDFLLQYTLYGDLHQGIGLNIDDANHLALQKQLKNKTIVGLSILIARAPYAPLSNNFNVNLFASKKFSNTEVYGQAGYRPINIEFLGSNFLKQSAIVGGVKLARQNKNFDHSLKAEARYYGFLFNFDYYNWDTVLYRKPAVDIYSNYANTIGSHLYPLRKFDTPFSQWAVFTEYGGSNVWSLGITGNYTYHFSKKIDAFADYDLNYINSRLDKVFGDQGERNSSFLYPFINIGLCYKPVENAFIKASITNKAMNLDLNYPTVYLLKNPCLQLSAFATFQ
jgi:hypothetical protein